MSRPVPDPTPDQVAAMQRAKKPTYHPYRVWHAPADAARALVEESEKVVPRRERLVRG